MAAVEAAKASTPPALLKVKLAELASALRTLTGAWTSEQLAALTGQPLQDSSPQGAGQPLAGPTLQKDASTEVRLRNGGSIRHAHCCPPGGSRLAPPVH